MTQIMVSLVLPLFVFSTGLFSNAGYLHVRRYKQQWLCEPTTIQVDLQVVQDSAATRYNSDSD